MWNTLIKIYALFLLLSLVSCGSKEPQDSFIACGTDASPYKLSDVNTDTFVFRLDYWWWLRNDGMWVDSNIVYRDLRYLNNHFRDAKIQFELNEIRGVIDERKFDNQKDYRKHGWQLEEWYYEHRDSIPFAIAVMIYPPDRQSPPGSALDIPSTIYSIQSIFLGYSTTVHEMGHCFNLFHTHQHDATDGRNYYTGDKVCDLPYHPPLVGNQEQCRKILDEQTDLSEEEKEAILSNWLTYIDFICRDKFSSDQIDRMRWTIENSADLRRALVN